MAPTAADWIGLYAVGAADSAFIAWQFINGSASGNVPIVVPNTTVAGAYELRLFANNTYTKLATSNGFTVDPPPPATLSVTGSASPGGSVTATWAAVLAPTAADWIGLYAPSASDNAFIAWRFTSGVAAGNVPFSLPANLAPGAYELRLFTNNSYTRLATSANFSVGQLALYFIHPDHLNTPRQVYDDQQQLRWRWDQAEPFGTNAPDENPSALGVFKQPLRYPGQYDDSESGISYNYLRDCYDPATGRYCQSDPIGLSGDLNTYAYVSSDPLRSTDPEGLFKQPGSLSYLPGFPTAPAIPVRPIAPSGQSLIGLAALGGVAVYLSSKAPDDVPFSVINIPGNDDKCAAPNDDDCAKRRSALQAEQRLLATLLKTGYKVTDRIKRYKRDAREHNRMCPRHQVDEFVSFGGAS